MLLLKRARAVVLVDAEGKQETALVLEEIETPTVRLLGIDGESFVCRRADCRDATGTEFIRFCRQRRQLAAQRAVDEHLRLAREGKN